MWFSRVLIQKQSCTSAMMFQCYRIVTVLFIIYQMVNCHPGGKKNHRHLKQTDNIVKLKSNIKFMEAILSKQEQRLTKGFGQLKKKVQLLDKMAAEIEIKNKNTVAKWNCSVPLAPHNGRILGLDYTEDSVPHLPLSGTIYYVCDDGFHVSGSERRTCLENGTWSGEEVTCVDISTKIASCAKLNCQNGADCVQEESRGQYRCRCRTGFYGKRCQKVRKQTSIIINTRCDNNNARKSCSCPTGYKIGADHNLCVDINECLDEDQPSNDVIPFDVGTLAKRDALLRRPLCLHQCVNTPGSYRCSCPPGYLVDASDERGCVDINECENGIHNCTGNQQCFNTGGSFKCIVVTCSSNYFSESPFVCRRESCLARKCLKDPLAYFHHFIDLPANLVFPTDIFRLVADKKSGHNVNRFHVLPGRDSSYFASKNTNSPNGILTLTRPFNHKESVSAEFEMKKMTGGKKRRLIAKYVYRVTVFQSPYDF